MGGWGADVGHACLHLQGRAVAHTHIGDVGTPSRYMRSQRAVRREVEPRVVGLSDEPCIRIREAARCCAELDMCSPSTSASRPHALQGRSPWPILLPVNGH
jgi:hypothetical protein